MIMNRRFCIFNSSEIIRGNREIDSFIIGQQAGDSTDLKDLETLAKVLVRIFYNGKRSPSTSDPRVPFPGVLLS